MVRFALTTALALLALLLLPGCTASVPEPVHTERFSMLNGSAATLALGDQRFALALFAPPAPMLLVRTGPAYFWITPSLTLRQVFLEDEVEGVPIDSHVLAVNATGTTDYMYTMRWSG
jgi:hypothetical protein